MRDPNMIRDGRDLGAFIPAHLDDYGLNPHEFRLYAHIARRAGAGQCWEGIANMAAACRMDVKTARAAAKRLTELRLINVQIRKGQTNVITLTPHSQWLPYDDTPTKSGRTTKSGTPTRSGSPPLPDLVGVPLPDLVGPPLPNLVPKGIPIEGYPYEGNPIKGAQKEVRFEAVDVKAVAYEDLSNEQSEQHSFDRPDDLCSGLVSSAPKSAAAKFEEGFQARMRVDPWMQCDSQLQQLFLEYVAGCYGDRRESQAKKMNVARSLIRNAKRSHQDTIEYERVADLWTAFVKNLHRSRTLEEATGKANTLDPEIREMMSR